VDALLERLAAVYYGLAGLVALLPASRPRAVGGAGLALLGLAAAADTIAPRGPAGAFFSINEGLALVGLGLVGAALWLARSRKTRGDRTAPPAPPPLPVSPAPDLPLVVGLLLAAFAPQVLLLALGVALALALAIRATARRGARLALLLLLLAAASIGIGFGLLLTILGSEGGSVAALSEGPLSLAAERLLTLLIGGGALALAGLPPFHRVPWGRNLAPLCAILLLRVVLPGFPAGLFSWQVAVLCLLLLSFAWSAVVGRWAQAVITAGLMVLWSGPDGALAGSALVGWGYLLELLAGIGAGRGMSLSPRWRGVTVLPAAFVALPALRAGLRAQVLLSVLTVAACVAGLLLHWKRNPREAHAPLY
jgi:hypothetical protein